MRKQKRESTTVGALNMQQIADIDKVALCIAYAFVALVLAVALVH